MISQLTSSQEPLFFKYLDSESKEWWRNLGKTAGKIEIPQSRTDHNLFDLKIQFSETSVALQLILSQASPVCLRDLSFQEKEIVLLDRTKNGHSAIGMISQLNNQESLTALIQWPNDEGKYFGWTQATEDVISQQEILVRNIKLTKGN
jgi:hypothetical protein